VSLIESRLANLAQTAGPGWNQLLTAQELTATRTPEEQCLWINRLACIFWTIQVHSTIHMPFVHSRAESKAVCLENARSLMFLYECIRAQFTTPAIRNILAFYGFASAVFLETMSNLPEDKKRVEHVKKIFEEDSRRSTIAFQASQILDYIRDGCLRANDGPKIQLNNPPPIILPYFGIIRIVDKKVTGRSVLEDDFNPKEVALHPPPPASKPLQDEFHAMNFNEPFQFGDNLNWDFNFGITSASQGDAPMDIEAFTSVSPFVLLLI
jgi:hypothetical protein